MGKSYQIAIKILAQNKQARKAFDEMGKISKRFTAKMRSSAAAIKKHWKAVAASLGTAIYAIKKVVGAYLVQEKAERDLGAAMKVTGTYTRAAHKDLLKFAAARQQVTKYGDELTLQNMALLQSFGMNTKEIKQATIAAQDFASGLNIDLRTAALLVGKAFAGDVATLSRYGIKIEEGLSKSEKFTAVMRQLNKQFGGRAQAELETYAGKIERLKNTWGDWMETAGKWTVGFIEGKYNPLAWLYGTYEDVQKAVGATEKAANKVAKMRKEQIDKIKAEAAEYEKVKKALVDYAGEIDSLGDTYLKLAKNSFARALKEAASIQELQEALQPWQAEIEKQYQRRRNMHLGIITDLANEKGAEEKLLAARIALGNSQMAMNEELLASYQGYYDSLEALQDKHLKERKSKLKELADFEKSTLKVREEIDRLIAAEKRALLGETESEEEQYYNTVTQLDRQYAEALKATGQSRLTALEEYIRTVKTAAEEFENIRTGDPFGGTGLVGDTALERMRQAQAEWETTKESITTAMKESAAASQEAAEGISQALDLAAKEIDYFRGEVQVMAREIENLKANIIVSLDDQASFGIAAIKKEMDALHDKTITITTRYITEAAQVEGSLATGTPYVPATGLYQLHQGEAVIPANQNRNSYDQRQDNRVNNYNAYYYGPQQGSRVERDFEIRQMFQNMQRYDASLTK